MEEIEGLQIAKDPIEQYLRVLALATIPVVVGTRNYLLPICRVEAARTSHGPNSVYRAMSPMMQILSDPRQSALKNFGPLLSH